MEDNNMTLWESNLTAIEKRILVKQFIGKAMKYDIADNMEDMRIGCFKCRV